MEKSIQHTETYRFAYMSPDISTREGVKMHAAHFTLENGDDRLLFYIADWPPLTFEPGQPVTVRFSGHILLDAQAESRKQ